MISEITVNVDEKLAVDKFNVDEGNAHIELAESIDDAEFAKLVLCCPAGLYKYDEAHNPVFDYAGCLECGTCRILCRDTIVAKWEYPQAGLGVSYRLG